MASNIELKARCTDLDAARVVAVALGAEPQGVESQTDTFFATPQGRLKLRESDKYGAMLIPYLRPDSREPKQSDYLVLPVENPAQCKQLFGQMLGVSAVVEKERELLLLDNVRIHLDRVEGLGTFIEFEAVMSDATTPERELVKVKDLMASFGIREADIESGAYVDLLPRQPTTYHR